MILIIIGVIMVAAGIVAWLVGAKRDIPNTVTWALFPILHGLHEFADWLIEDSGIPVDFSVERFELIFAFASSIALLAAIIEYNGSISHPAGDAVGLILMTFFGFLFFYLPEEAIENIAGATMVTSVPFFGEIVLEPFRFLYGFLSPILGIIFLLITLRLIIMTARVERMGIDTSIKRANVIMVLFLSVFAVFEGFDSDSWLWIGGRGITLAMFIVIPAFVILTSKVGLQRLYIVKSTGNLLLAYDFVLRVDQKSAKVSDEAVLTAGFLAAITAFSQEMSKSGGSFVVRSNRFYFSLIKHGDTLFALQSMTVKKQLTESFVKIVQKIGPDMMIYADGNTLDRTPLLAAIKDEFKRFY